MKKMLYCAAALATLLFAGSCQKETIEPEAGGVTYTITLADGVQTKGSSGYTQYDLYYEVYKTVDATELDAATAPLFEKKVEDAFTDHKATITLDLLNDQDYTILFWANKKGEAWFNTANLRNVEMVQSASNNNDRDAFCGKDQIVNHNTAFSKTVELKRPFAQLNIATLVPTEAEIGYNVTPNASTVVVSDIPVAYNVATASPVGTDTEVTFTKNLVPSDKTIDVTTNGNTTKYNLVAMNYVLVPASNIEVTYEIETVNGTVTNTIKNVPVKPNYRTNIIGNLLTSDASYTVEIKPGFEDPTGGNMEVLNDGIVKNINGDYEITNANGLVYAIENLFEDVAVTGTFYILNSIDMTGVGFNPATVTGKTVHIVGAMPVVTRSTSTTSTTGITITGLTQPLIASVEEGATASFSSITIATDADLVGENDGTVFIQNCENADGDTEDHLIGDADNDGTGTVIKSNEITTFEAFKAAVAAGVHDITLGADVSANEKLVINKSVTINGANHKLTTSTDNRAIEIAQAGVQVVINDLNVVVTKERIGYSDIRGIAVNQISNVELTLNNCTVDFEHASAHDWSYAVNFAGNSSGHKVTVNGGSYEGANVINIWGKDHTVNIDGATLTSLYAFNDMYTGVCVHINMNESNPSSGSVVTIKNTTFNGSHAVATMDSGDNTITLENCTDNTKFAPVKVGSSYYYTLTEAVNAIQTEGTVTVLSSIEIESATVPVTIPSGKTVTLDLNGNTITGVDNSEKNFSIIDNKGNLTVKNGTMKLSATINSGWGRYSAVIANNPGGNLTLAENLVIEHLGGTDMAYGIDNLTNGKGTSAITTVNGATVKSPYRAIRQFLNGIEATNELYVKAGSKIIGSNKSIWMQDPNKNANSGKLVVEEGAELDGDVYLFVTAGSTEWPVSVSIAESALVNDSEVLSANVPDGYAVENINGKWLVLVYDDVADGLKKARDLNVYLVSSAAGLSKMNNMFADKTAGKDTYFFLSSDIDFNGNTWTPVDSHADTNFSFSGLDGKGHTISNMTINGQAMFTRFAGSGDVVIKNVTFDNATVNSTAINTSILTVQSYQNVLLDNVDVKNSAITGGYKVAPLIATVYNENPSTTITATLKNCDVENVTVKATSYDFCTTGMVAFVYADDNDQIEFENCTVKDIKLIAPNDSYKAHAAIYTTGSGSLYNEAQGVTVMNVTFEVLK